MLFNIYITIPRLSPLPSPPPSPIQTYFDITITSPLHEYIIRPNPLPYSTHHYPTTLTTTPLQQPLLPHYTPYYPITHITTPLTTLLYSPLHPLLPYYPTTPLTTYTTSILAH